MKTLLEIIKLIPQVMSVTGCTEIEAKDALGVADGIQADAIELIKHDQKLKRKR